MNMTNGNVRVSMVVIFRAVLLMSNLALVAGMLWIRAEIRKELGGYVTKAEFLTYEAAHTKWGDEVVRRLQASVDELNRRADRIEAKVDQLMLKGTQ